MCQRTRSVCQTVWRSEVTRDSLEDADVAANYRKFCWNPPWRPMSATDFWGRLRVCVLFDFEVDLHLAWTRVTVHHFDGRVRPPRDRSPENNHSRGFFPSHKTSAGSIFSLFNGWPLVLLQALLEIGAVTCLLFPIKKNGPPAVPTCSIRELELKCI